MANITIKDLPESIELDREAMHAITGGARGGNRHANYLRILPNSTLIVGYPASVRRNVPPTNDLSVL